MTRPYNNQQKREVPKLKESEQKDKHVDLALELKKTVEHGTNNDTNREWCFCYSHQRISNVTGRLGNKRTSGYYLKYYIIEHGQNT